MQVHVRYFAVLRERAGVDDSAVEVERGTTVGEMYLSLFPPGEEGVMPVLFAVNQQYVSKDHQLMPGDEVAFIPPLGGG